MAFAPRNRYLSSAQVWSKTAAAITLAVGALVLAGWWFNIAVLKSILPGAPVMKVNAALAFLLAGLALGLLQIDSSDRRLLTGRRVCAGVVALIGLLTLAEYAFGWQLGIDQLLAPDVSASAGLFPGRAAVLTALNFVLLGLALLFLDVSRRYRMAQLFTLVASLVALLALIGYLYGAEAFYRLSNGNAMALHTAITFLILSLGLLLVRPTHGWMTILASDSAGGVLARRLLPAAVIVPVVLGWLRLQGQNAGLYDTRFGLALFATSNIIVFTLLIAASAGSLFRTDMARQQAENNIKRLNAGLEQRVLERTSQLTAANQKLETEAAERERAEAKFRALLEAAPDAMIIINPAAKIILVNSQAENLFGYSRAALLGQSVERLVPKRFHGQDFARRAGQFTGRTPSPEGGGPDLYGLRSDGSEFPVEMTISTIETDEGILHSSAIRDITERRQMEAALAQERDLLQALLDNVPDTIYFKDTASRFTRVNLAQARVLGVAEPADAIGKTDFDFQWAEMSQQSFEREQLLIATNQPLLDWIEYNPTPDGQARWFSTTKVPLTNRQGRVQGLIGISRDITQRMQAEEGQRQANAALTERVGQMSLLQELEEQLQACLTIDEVYQATAKIVSQLFPDESGALYVINSSRNWVETVSEVLSRVKGQIGLSQ